MKGLVLIGGIPFQGKSYFSKAFARNNSGFKHFNFDKEVDNVIQDPDLFVRLLSNSNFPLYMALQREVLLLGENPIPELIYRQFKLHGKDYKEQSLHITEKCTLAYLANEIYKNDYSIVEGKLIKQSSRTTIYDDLSMYKHTDIPTVFVLFNQGLEWSLRNHRTSSKSRRKNEGITTITSADKKTIKEMYNEQELFNGEIPNCTFINYTSRQQDLEYQIKNALGI